MPKGVMLFILALTKPNSADRLSIREAQNHPWIRGDDTKEPYYVVHGDYHRIMAIRWSH